MSEQNLAEIKRKIKNNQCALSRLRAKERDPEGYALKNRNRARKYWANLDPKKKAEVIRKASIRAKENRKKVNGYQRKSYLKHREEILEKKKALNKRLRLENPVYQAKQENRAYQQLSDANKILFLKSSKAPKHYFGTRPYDVVHNCLACGEDYLVKARSVGAKKFYCSRKCMMINVKAKGVLENIQFRIDDPIYQAKQLGLIEVRARQVRKTVRTVKFYG
jgi:hypothetical protein